MPGVRRRPDQEGWTMKESTAKPSSGRSSEVARTLIRPTKLASRRRFPAEEKIRTLLEGIKYADSVVENDARIGRVVDKVRALRLDRRRRQRTLVSTCRRFRRRRHIIDLPFHGHADDTRPARPDHAARSA